LPAVNGISGFDFTAVFERYAYDTTILPLYVEDGQLKIDHTLLPEIPQYNPPDPPLNLTGEWHPDFTATTRWDSNREPDLAGYNVYRTYGMASWPLELSAFKRLNGSLIEENFFHDEGAPNGLPDNYVYYVVTAVNSSGEESLYSNMVGVPEFHSIYLPVALCNY
jgi:hypothetical protein